MNDNETHHQTVCAKKYISCPIPGEVSFNAALQTMWSVLNDDSCDLEDSAVKAQLTAVFDHPEYQHYDGFFFLLLLKKNKSTF